MKKWPLLLLFFTLLESQVFANGLPKTILDAILRCDLPKTQQLLVENPYFDLSVETQFVMLSNGGQKIFRSMSLMSAGTACHNVDLFILLRSHALKNGKGINAFVNRWNESVLFWAIVFWNQPVIHQILDSESDPVDVTPVAISETVGQFITLHDVVSIGDYYITFEFPNKTSFEIKPNDRNSNEKRLIQQKLLEKGAPKSKEVYYMRRGTQQVVVKPNLFRIQMSYHPYIGKGKKNLPDHSPFNVYSFSKDSPKWSFPGRVYQVLTRSGMRLFAVAGEDDHSEYILAKSIEGEDLEPLTLGDEVIQFDEFDTGHVIQKGSVALTGNWVEFNVENLEGELPILIFSQGVAGGAAGYLIESLLRKHPGWATRIRLIQSSPLSAIPDWGPHYQRWIQQGIQVVVATGRTPAQIHTPDIEALKGVRIFTGRIQEVIPMLINTDPSFFGAKTGHVPHVFAVGSKEFMDTSTIRPILEEVKTKLGLEGYPAYRTNNGR